MIRKHTPSTREHTAELVGQSDIVINSGIIRRREGDTHGHNESPYEESIEK
jgi:hypothetical protein